MHRRERIAAWALAATITACGGRTDLNSSAGQPAAVPCASWTVAPGGPVAITDPVLRSALTGVSVDGDRVFVASEVFTHDAPTVDPGGRVRVVSGDLQTIGPSQVAPTTSPPSFPSLLATGFGHRGMIMGGAQAPVANFVELSDDGAAMAPPVALDEAIGFQLFSATETGFIYFASANGTTGPLSRISLDPAGHVVDETPGVIAAPSISLMASARFDDGTMLGTWLSGPSSAVVAQRVGETGGALSSPTTLQNPVTAEALTPFAVTSAGSSGLVVWPAGESAPGEVDVQPIDEDGNPTGPATAVAPADGTNVAWLDAAPVAGGALVAWTKGVDTLMVRAVSTTGAPIGSPLSVPSPKPSFVAFLAPTPAGVVLAFDIELEPAHFQVFAVRLVCGA